MGNVSLTKAELHILDILVSEYGNSVRKKMSYDDSELSIYALSQKLTRAYFAIQYGKKR